MNRVNTTIFISDQNGRPGSFVRRQLISSSSGYNTLAMTDQGDIALLYENEWALNPSSAGIPSGSHAVAGSGTISLAIVQPHVVKQQGYIRCADALCHSENPPPPPAQVNSSVGYCRDPALQPPLKIDDLATQIDGDVDLRGPCAGELLHNGICLVIPKDGANLSDTRVRAPPYVRHPPEVINISLGRQLLAVDDFLIASPGNLQRKWHAVQYDDANPVLSPTKEWEGSIAMPFSSGAWYDEEAGAYKLYYNCGAAKNMTCLAVSDDAKTWRKPVLTAAVRKGTNIVREIEHYDTNVIWYDHVERNSSRRWKMSEAACAYCDHSFGLLAGDGITWEVLVKRTGYVPDRSTIFFDPFRSKWVFSIKSAQSHKGQGRCRAYWESTDLLDAHLSNWTHDPLWKTDCLVSRSGRVESCGKGIPRPWVGTDEGEAHLAPPIAKTVSSFKPELYNLDAVGYESMMVGAFSILQCKHTDDPTSCPGGGEQGHTSNSTEFNAVFAGFSRDGWHWSRTDVPRRPLAGLSPDPSAWNYEDVQSTGGGFLVQDDILRFFFSGRRAGMQCSTTGTGTLRRDGFASLQSNATSTLTTRAVQWNSGLRHMFVNFRGDRLRVGIRTVDEPRLPGFALSECVGMTRADSTRAEIRWTGAADLKAVAGKVVQIMIEVTNGELFSFWVAENKCGASRGPLAAGGPSAVHGYDMHGSCKTDDTAAPSTCSGAHYTYVAHSWQATCSTPGTIGIFSNAFVALQKAGATGQCARYGNILPMIDLGGSPFAPSGFGDLANETVPCLVHGNAATQSCPQHSNLTRCGSETAWCIDTKGSWPLGLLKQASGSRVVHVEGPQRDAIMDCAKRGAQPGSATNLSRCADRIAVPECDGQLPATAFGHWEFTLWWDSAMAELRGQADKFFASLAKTGATVDEIVQDTEMIESHYARIVAPRFMEWYPGQQKFVGSKIYPTISDACARARWLAIQKDRRWPALLEQLTARGFRANTSEPEYLAKAMGLYITAPCVGDGNAYAMTDSTNQAVFNTVMSERFATGWASTYYEAAQKFYPNIRSSNYDMRKRHPAFCIPERVDGIADCSVAGGGVVGMQAMNAYPNEYNATLITPSLVKYFGFPANESYELTPFNLMRWILLHQRTNVLAGPTVPTKPWIFPKSVCYAGHACPLITKNGKTHYEEMLFHLALAGSRGFLLFNPFFDYVSVIEPGTTGRVSMLDYKVLSIVLSELTEVVDCEGAVWVRDGSLRFEDSFLLSGMLVTPALKVWRLTLQNSTLVDARESIASAPNAAVLNISGVSAKLPSGEIAACDLLFSGGSVLEVNGSASALGLWISQPASEVNSEAKIWLQCVGGERMDWPPPDHVAPPAAHIAREYSCRGGLCVEAAEGNFTQSTCDDTCVKTDDADINKSAASRRWVSYWLSISEVNASLAMDTLRQAGGKSVATSVMVDCGDTIGANGTLQAGGGRAHQWAAPCDAEIPAQLAAMGIGFERLIQSNGGGWAPLRAMLASPQSSIAAIVRLAKAQKLRGVTWDGE